MILNYHTLCRLSKETAHELVGAKIIEVFSQSRSVLHIGLVTTDRRTAALEMAAEKGAAYVVLRKDYRRKSKNSADLFPEAVGRKITESAMDPVDRIVRIRLSGGLVFELEMFASVNIYLTDENGKILDAFKDSKDHVGQVRSGSETRPSYDLGNIRQLEETIPDMVTFKMKLSEGLWHFNKYLAMECLHQSEVLEECFQNMTALLSRLYREEPRVYRLYGEPVLFSLIDLKHYRLRHPSVKEEIFRSVNEALLAYLGDRAAFGRRKEKLQDMRRALRLRLKKNESLILALRDDLEKAGSFELVERQGHLLNLHISKLVRGMDRAVVEDAYDEKGGVVEIPLNPEWAPKKNIEEYFARAKKMRQSVDKVAGRIRTLESETTRLKTLQEEIEDEERRDWKKIEKTYDEWVRLGWIKRRKEDVRAKPEKEVPSFREFMIPGNWRVFVGQNDTKNDQLTFKFAKSDDYWFHARGVPGSHVILKRDGRKDNPGKQAIESAASIAAFFSKARTSSLVPVAYTLKKYVRKPKGSRPGQVVIEREEVVIVPPKEMN